MKRIFVTGTGTDVGKTIVTRAIVRALVNRGKTVRALKPAESGVPVVDGEPAPADVLALRAAAKSDAPVSSLCAYLFPDPVSPHLAAANQGMVIEPERIHQLLKDNEVEGEIVVAEGAGGLLVPLSNTLLYADVIAASGYELLIVAPDVLGTINATLATIETARARKIPVMGVVMNRGPNPALGNRDAIAAHGQVKILGCLPDTPLDDEALAAAAEAHLDLDFIAKGNP